MTLLLVLELWLASRVSQSIGQKPLKNNSGFAKGSTEATAAVEVYKHRAHDALENAVQRLAAEDVDDLTLTAFRKDLKGTVASLVKWLAVLPLSQ